MDVELDVPTEVVAPPKQLTAKELLEVRSEHLEAEVRNSLSTLIGHSPGLPNKKRSLYQSVASLAEGFHSWHPRQQESFVTL